MAGVSISTEGAQAMTDMAQALPQYVEDITQQTANVYTTYNDNQDVLGPHSDQIEEIITLVQTANNESAESIDELSEKMLEVAEDILEIVAKKLHGNP